MQKDLVFFKKEGNVIQEGTSREVLSSIPSMLESIAQAKSLIAWLKEAIKAKNDLINRAGVLCFSSYKGEEQILPA